MRLLILGGTGMLGRAVVALARTRGTAALALSHGQASLEDPARLSYFVDAFRPDVIVNCAAYTKVDLCEGAGRGEAFAINGDAVASVAAAARRAGARLLHVSTDYVFDGRAAAPYAEDAATAPLSVYGQSKLRGEHHALGYEQGVVVRTSWLFGPGGPNFAATMVQRIDGSLPLRVVADQHGCPTYTPFLAKALLDLAALPVTGVFHYRNAEPTTWHGFAVEIARLASGPRGPAEVTPVSTSEFPRPAPRPAYSVLGVERFESAVGRRVEPWLAGLVHYLSLLETENARRRARA